MPPKSKSKKTASGKKSTKTSSTKTKETAPPPAPVQTPVLETTSSTSENVVVSTTNEQFTEFSAKLQQLVGILSSLRADFKALEKVHNKEVRLNKKLTAKKRKSRVIVNRVDL